MPDARDRLSSEMRKRAEELARRARRATDAVRGTASPQDADAQRRLVQTRETVRSLVERIDALRERVVAERQPLEAAFAAARESVGQAGGQAEALAAQIKEKEAEIGRLSGKRLRKRTPLGELDITDPEALSRANALRAEVAGLYGALATARRAEASAHQALDELRAHVEQVPIEADPRLAELYGALKDETDRLEALQGAGLGAAAPHRLFSDDARARVTEVVRARVAGAKSGAAGAPTLDETVAQVEAVLARVLPRATLRHLEHEDGFTGDMRGFTTRLPAAVAKALDLPDLDEGRKEEIARAVLELLADGLRESSSLEAALDRAGHGQKPERPGPKKGQAKRKQR